MSNWEAILLGFIQGLAEFLPISSDGHLALAAFLFDVKEAGLTFNVMLHAGTLLATVLLLREPVLKMVKSGLGALRSPELFRTTPGGQDAFFVLIASLPTALIGLGLRDAVEQWTLSPTAVGWGFIGTALVLVATYFAKPGVLEHPSWRLALLVGVAQGMAVLPGVSRSGSTIALLLFLGVQRRRAFELSMLMSVPAVLGAVLLELPHALAALEGMQAALLGAVVAFFTGCVALWFVQKVVLAGKFSWFALWVFPVAFATLAMARVWPG